MRASLLVLPLLLAIGLGGCSAEATASRVTLEPQRAAAADAAAKADVSAAKVAVIAYQASEGGALPTPDQLSGYGYTASDDVSPITISGTAADFCVAAVSATGAVFHASLSGSVEDGAC